LQLLLGPFVDVEQPLIAGGMIDMAYHQLFQTQVRQVNSHTRQVNSHTTCCQID
jgi:hypothetical protein